MTGKRYLVTGGAGFIGSHLVEALLASGHSVRVLDDLSTGRRSQLDPRAAFVHADVADPVAVREAARGVDGVFHLAAIASVQRGNEDWPGTSRVNLGGTVAVLDAARAAGVPVVYASSAAVYGDGGNLLLRETQVAAPRTAYGADKLAGELHARAGALVHGLRSVGLRFFNVYGPRQDPSSSYSGVISIFDDRLGQGRDLCLHGDGSQTRDFVQVADVVAHLAAAIRHLDHAKGASVFNVCTGRATSIRDLAHTIAAARGIAATTRFGPQRAGDIQASVGDPAAAIAALGVRATTLLPSGLAELIARPRDPA